MKICLVGASHVCHNPRLVREADLLSSLGHDVRVVALSFVPELAARNRRLMDRRRWKLEEVDFQPANLVGRCRSFAIRGRRRIASRIAAPCSWARGVEVGYSLGLPELERLAGREPADWFIAHTQAALPAASRAARRWSARLGFDCEDLLAESGTDDASAVRHIERRYLADCDYVSVPSRSIGAHLSSQYGLRAPVTLYNVFPTSLADGLELPSLGTTGASIRLHWMSQTIGYGRGLEDAAEAVALLGEKVELHLRGTLSPAYRADHEAMLERLGIRSRVFIHGTLPHDDLIRSMGVYDVGLSLESPANGNYARTVTNKMFSYLLAGLAVAATDTPGQREVMDQCPGVGFLYDAGSADALAAGLEAWIEDRAALLEARHAAWHIARSRFCWDVESRAFLQALGLEADGRTNRVAQ